MSLSKQPLDEPVKRRLVILAGISALGAAGAQFLTPKAADEKLKAAPRIDLDALIPRAFGTWKATPSVARTVNPETQQILDRLYSQIIERTYVDNNGYIMMLSIAYGADQRGSMEAHKPEVCYPAQGFEVKHDQAGTLQTDFGNIAVRRLNTQNGARHEPLTYWFSVGNSTVQSRLQKRIAEIKMTLTGQIPDGLLFRVSSLDKDSNMAWEKQASFVNAMISMVDASLRKRLTGL